MSRYYISWFISLLVGIPCIWAFVVSAISFQLTGTIGPIIALVILSAINKMIIGGFFPIPRGIRAANSASEIAECWKTNRAIVYEEAARAVFWLLLGFLILGNLSRVIICAAESVGYRGHCSSISIIDLHLFAIVFGIFWFLKLLLRLRYGKNYRMHYNNQISKNAGSR